jgi:integrase/recombinase XerD
MATVSIVLRTDRINKKGEAPINFFVLKHRKLSKIATGILINPKFWDEKNKRVKGTHKSSGRLNAFLSNKFAELNDSVLENETISKSLTVKQIKNKIYGQAPTNFFDFAKDVLAGYEAQKMFGTYDKAAAIVNKMKKFVGSETLFLQEINAEWLTKYDNYCREEWENKTNTVHKDMKFIRKVFNDAIRMDKVDMKDNPFLKYKLKVEKTQRTFLSEDELTAFAKVKCTPGTRMELHQDMFVFAAYTGGLRVSDVLQLKWKNIDKTHINFTIQKTGTQLSIRVPDKAMAIIDKYKSKNQNKEHYIFPMLSNSLKEDDLRLMDREISGATAYINKNLKEIAKVAEITKPISFHISRHTFATRALRKGISIDKVSKLMGHSAIRETQVYAKIVNEELDKAMLVFND